MNSPFFVFSFTNLGRPVFLKKFFTLFEACPHFFQNFDSGLLQDFVKEKTWGQIDFTFLCLKCFPSGTLIPVIRG